METAVWPLKGITHAYQQGCRLSKPVFGSFSAMNTAAEIEYLIRARYPILYLVTGEEDRVVSLVADIAKRWQKTVFEWTCTSGMVPLGTSIHSQKTRHSATKDPLTALDHVVDHVEPALFVFKDLHPFLTRSNHAVVRRLKDIASHLKNTRKTIIIVSPILEVPPEIEKEITVIQFPLPGLNEMSELIGRVADEVSALRNVVIDLDAHGCERLAQAALGLTLAEAENVLAKIIVKHERLSGDLVGEMFVEKQQIIKKNGLLEYYAAAETFDVVGGLDILKEWVRKRGKAFTPEARAFGLPAPKGMLLLGVQGCGKSLCAKAVSTLWQVPLLRFDVGRVFGSLVGSSEENIRRAIAVAESIAPAVLWVDEIDKAFAGSAGSALVDGGTTARVFGTFLTWLSEKTAPVFVVATANDISQLPPELLRKGRLDEIFFVDLPNETERAEIFRIHIRKRQRDDSKFDIARLVAASDQFSGAEIEEAVISALYDAFDDGREVTTEDILASLRQAVPLARTMAEQIQRLRQWAEGRARNASKQWQ